MEIMFDCDQTLPVSPVSPTLRKFLGRSAPSTPSAPSPPPSEETIIGDFAYSTSRLIGKSDHSEVYKGRRISNKEVIAVKVISKKKAFGKLNFSKTQLDFFDQFIELKHPHIVNLFGYHDSEEKFYIFMEYCNQKDLDAYITRMTTLSESSIKFFLRQISEAMKFLNDKGIVHRDLKPSNILLSSREEKPISYDMFVKISDFGFAHFLDDDAYSPICGISPYMAPEIILGQHYNSKADLWSIGAIASHCFNGEPHIEGSNKREVIAFYKRVKSCVVNRPLGISDEFWRNLFGLLQPVPSKRINFNTFYNNNDKFWKNVPTQPSIRQEHGPFSFTSSEYSSSSSSSSSSEKGEKGAESGVGEEGKEEEPKSEEATAEEPDVGSPFEEIPRNLNAEGEIEETATTEGENESKNEKPGKDDVMDDDFVVIAPPTDRVGSGCIIEAVFHPIFEVYLPVLKGESPEPPRRLS